MKLREIDMEKLGFHASTEIFIQDNLSPYFSELAWKCRKLKKKKDLWLKIQKGNYFFETNSEWECDKDLS